MKHTIYIIEASCPNSCNPTDVSSNCDICNAWLSDKQKALIERALQRFNIKVQWVGLFGRMSLPRFIVNNKCMLGEDPKFRNEACNFEIECECCPYGKF